MPNIIEEIMKHVPKEAQISETYFEGANIILYTKSPDFLLKGNETIKNIVSLIKKRIELRADPSLTKDPEESEEAIRSAVPEEAKISNILFDPQRSIVVIEAEKPGLVIGKQGELLKEIKKKILWIPLVQRTPALRSKIIENIRSALYENNDYRKKFLHKVGQRIYDGWTTEKKQEWVRVTVLGAGRQVGRSCFHLQTPGSRILLDCGINPSVSEDTADAYPHFDCPDFDLSKIDAVILSHAHMDHSGVIPYLYKMGYKGPVYTTAPTRDVAALLALDSIGVAFKQAKKNIYDLQHVKDMVLHTITLDWEEVTDVTPDIRLTFYNSGHILGSSLTHLHISNGLHNLLYTGDMKYIRTKLLDPAHTQFPRLETMIIESTYGGKDNIMTSRRDAELALVDIVKDAITKQGKVLIPVFGVGRAQEVMMVLEYYMRTNQFPRVPIYVQGMVWDITAIHTAYPDFLNRELRQAIFHRDTNPFLSDIFIKVGSKKEQEQLLEKKEACVILATAGMMNAGPSLEYFKRLADNPNNALVMVGYNAEGTAGRRVQNGEKEILFTDNGKPEHITVRMSVHTLDAFSGHASRTELLKYVHDIQPKPKKIITNHGESSRCIDLASSVHKINKVETGAPRNLESLRLK